MTEQEQKEWDLKLREIDAQIANLNAATDKLITENRWYVPAVSAGIASGATLAIVAIVKLFL